MSTFGLIMIAALLIGAGVGVGIRTLVSGKRWTMGVLEWCLLVPLLIVLIASLATLVARWLN